MKCLRSADDPADEGAVGRMRSDTGLESVEYALIAAVMLTALFVVVPTFANQLAPAYNAVINTLINSLN